MRSLVVETGMAPSRLNWYKVVEFTTLSDNFQFTTHLFSPPPPTHVPLYPTPLYPHALWTVHVQGCIHTGYSRWADLELNSERNGRKKTWGASRIILPTPFLIWKQILLRKFLVIWEAIKKITNTLLMKQKKSDFKIDHLFLWWSNWGNQDFMVFPALRGQCSILNSISEAAECLGLTLPLGFGHPTISSLSALAASVPKTGYSKFEFL